MEIQFEEDLYKEEKLKEKIKLLLQIPGNSECIECGKKDPDWASTSFGIFLCITCSGIHRNLGVHISRVKSTLLDNWKREELETMRNIGNANSKKIWESNVPPYFLRPYPNDQVIFKEQFIRAKYERKEYSGPQTNQSQNSNYFPSKQGYLTKQGKVVKNWKYRFFHLHGTLLLYFKKQKDQFPAGQILLKDATKIECFEEPFQGHPFCFSVQTPDREYFLTAENATAMYQWVQSLRSAKYQLCTENTNGKRAADINVEEIWSKLLTGVQLGKRKYNKKLFQNCFVGASAVDWMVYNLNLISRKEAVLIGEKLLSQGKMQCVVTTESTLFDSEALYQFL